MAFGTAACRARHLCTNGSYVVALAAANGSGRDKLAAAVRLKKAVRLRDLFGRWF